MEYLKLVGRNIVYVFSIIIISTIIITLFNYINFFNTKVTSIFKLMVLLISIFIGGYNVGKRSKHKGWLEGIKFGIIVVLILILMNLVFFKQGFDIKNLLYYLILITSTIFGSMVGINKRIDSK